MRLPLAMMLIAYTVAAGCGTTKFSDTGRTATEQLLISDVMDRAVAKIDLRAVAGKNVYLDSAPIRGATDSAYLISLLRQHMLAAGCIIEEDRAEADYIVEVRAGAVGTDRRDVLFGVPSTQIGGVVPVTGVPSSLPEIPLAKKTEQRAVAKIAMFAYNRKTGRPIWQSGVIPVESRVKNVWFLGAGPFERGTIYDGTNFAGKKVKIPLVPGSERCDKPRELVSVTKEAFFAEPQPSELEEKEVAAAGEQQIAAADAPKEPETAEADAEPAAEPAAIAQPEKPGPATGQVLPAGHASPIAPPKPSLLPKPPKVVPIAPQEQPPWDSSAEEPPLPDAPVSTDLQPLPRGGPPLQLLPTPSVDLPRSDTQYQPLLDVPESTYLPPGFPDLPYELRLDD